LMVDAIHCITPHVTYVLHYIDQDPCMWGAVWTGAKATVMRCYKSNEIICWFSGY
jgi:hypothetical protein